MHREGAAWGDRCLNPFVCPHSSCLQLGLPKGRESNCTDYQDPPYAIGPVAHEGQLGNVGRQRSSGVVGCPRS